jgi:type II secretory pathway pseudopilin PulG
MTLVELLVAIGIVGVLIAVILPSVGRARSAARQIACAGNLRQVGSAIVAYAADHRGTIPYGPEAAPMSFFNFYPVTGNVTSLISNQAGQPVGLGLLLRRYLAQAPRSLFCPGVMEDDIADANLKLFGVGQAQSDYYYRHGSGGDAYTPVQPDKIRLASLGKNSAGEPIRALAMDVQFIADPALSTLNIHTRTAHTGRRVNVLYAEGQVLSLSNDDGRYTVDSRVFLARTFRFILQAMERADTP